MSTKQLQIDNPDLSGRMVHLTREEARDLAEYAEAMRAASKGQRKGWLAVYVRGHSAAGRTLRRMINRSNW